MKLVNLFLVLVLNAIFSFAQDLQLINTIDIQEPTEVSLDRVGNIYYAAFNGDIIKYDPFLKTELTFSPSNPNTTTILEAWQGLRVFSFHKDLQQFRLINRNLSLHEDYSFPQEIVSFVEIATPSYDNNIWLFDQVDFSLKKYDITTNRLWSTTPLNQILNPNNYEILFCKEYQNRLFISTRGRGILIFDNFGNYIKTFDYKGITFFNFWKDIMYFLVDNKLIKIDLYDENNISLVIPNHADWLFALLFEDRVYLFSKNQINLYK